MDAGEAPVGKPARQSAADALSDFELWGVIAAAVAAYVGLQLAGAGLPDSVKVGVPFLFLPLLARRLWHKPWDLGKFDMTLLLSALAYAPFAVIAALAAGGSPWFYAPLAATFAASGAAIAGAVDTFIHVGAVDYFTKAIVQREAELRFGRWNAFYLQLVAWSGGHAVEWLWLRLILGDVVAAGYLVAAGIVTGLAYMRWKNVLGLMIGHFLVNVAAAAAAASLYG